MKKFLGGILFVIIAATIAAPLVSGLVAEKLVKQSFNNLNTMYANTGSAIELEILRYERHYATTEIEWKMKLGALKALSGVDEIYFIDRADHRLAGIVSRTSLEKNQWLTDFIDRKLAGKNPLTITTEYSLSGQIRSTIAMDAFSLPVDDEVVEVKDGQAVGTCDKELKNFFSELSWKGLSIDEKMQVDGVSVKSSLEMVSSYVWEGKIAFGIEHSRIAGGQQPFELAKFTGDYTVDVDKDENTLSMVTAVGADQLVAGLQKVENGFVRIGLVNIDIPGFEAYMKLYTQMANSVLKDLIAADESPEQMKRVVQEELAQTQFQLMAAYESLLKKGLEFQLSDLHANLPEGEVTGDVTLSLNKDMTFAQFVPVLQQPKLALDIFSLQSGISLPAKLVGDNPMLLSPIYMGMETGLFIKEGDHLVHRAETRDGKLYLNAREVALQ